MILISKLNQCVLAQPIATTVIAMTVVAMTVVAMGEGATSPCCDRTNALHIIARGHSMQFSLFNDVFECPQSSLFDHINLIQKVRQNPPDQHLQHQRHIYYITIIRTRA
jgi:hypothetical protein